MNRLFSTGSTPKTMASQLRKVSHVVFDMDGLLLGKDWNNGRSLCDPKGLSANFAPFVWLTISSTCEGQRFY